MRGIKPHRVPADGAVMVTSTLADALRRARASWRGQLVVLGVGAMLLGLTLLGGGDAADLQLRMLVGSVEVLLLLAASIRMALIAEAGFDGDLPSVGFDVLSMLPRLLTQVGLLVAFPMVVSWLALQLASLMPAVGLLTVPIAFAVVAFTAGPALLAICAVVQQDRDWLPRSTIRAVRGHQVALAGIVLAGGVLACLASVPLALVGLVVNAVGGMLGFAGVGLVAAGALPWLGCGALATWRAIGATIDAPAEQDGAAVDAAPATRVGADVDLAAAFGVTPDPVTTWLDGPAWDVAVEPGAAWGTWIRIDAPSVLGFRISWHGGSAPLIAFASEAGVWTQPGPVRASGDVLQAALPAGSTYVQLTSRAAAAQAVTLSLLVPPAVVAA